MQMEISQMQVYFFIFFFLATEFRKMKKIKRKLLPKLLISRTLTFNSSATECPIEIKFSVLDSIDQGLQHIPL